MTIKNKESSCEQTFDEGGAFQIMINWLKISIARHQHRTNSLQQQKRMIFTNAIWKWWAKFKFLTDSFCYFCSLIQYISSLCQSLINILLVNYHFRLAKRIWKFFVLMIIILCFGLGEAMDQSMSVIIFERMNFERISSIIYSMDSHSDVYHFIFREQ